MRGIALGTVPVASDGRADVHESCYHFSTGSKKGALFAVYSPTDRESNAVGLQHEATEICAILDAAGARDDDLVFWDRVRLAKHQSLTCVFSQFSVQTILLSAGCDPRRGPMFSVVRLAPQVCQSL